jgi:hypothetical protein
MRQELTKTGRSEFGGRAGRASLHALASKRGLLSLVLAAGFVGILTGAPASAFAATTPLVSTSTSHSGGGDIGNGTTLTVNFNEAPTLAGSYGLTLADGNDTGTLSTADGNLSASVSGDSITFTAHGAPVGSPGTINLGNPVEILSATGISDGSGNPWDLVASGEIDERLLLAGGDQIVVTYDEPVTADPTSFSLDLTEGKFSATIDQSNATIDSASSGDTVIYDVKSSFDGTIPTDGPTVSNFGGIVGTPSMSDPTPPAPAVALTSPPDSQQEIYVNGDPDNECGNISGLTRVFGGSNCSISDSGPIAPDVFDVIPLPTTDLPGGPDDNAPEVITNCEAGSTDTAYDVNTGAELGTNPCGNNPDETAIGNTNSDTLDYIPTPHLASFEEAGVIESVPGTTYVSPTAVPPQLSGITVEGSQATFNYYTPVDCENGSGDYATVSQFTYVTPYTNLDTNALTYPSSISCNDPSDAGGSTSVTVTWPDPIPFSSGVRFKFTGYSAGHFIIAAPDSPLAYEREASESAYAGPTATITSFTPSATTLSSSAGGTVGVSFATTDALTCSLSAVASPASAASLALPSAASCNGSGTITVPANTSVSSPAVYTVTLTADGVSGTPPANAEITITVPAATPAPGTTGGGSPSTPPKQSIISLRLLKLQLTKIHDGAKFKFTATSGVTGYLCALVRLPSGKKHHAAPKLHYAYCSASKSYKNLKSGHYKLYVKAIGTGLVSGVLTKTFSVTDTKLKSKKHHG